MPGNYLHRAQSSRISISHAQSNELVQFTITLHSFLMGLVHQAMLVWSSHLASIFSNPTISQQQKSAFSPPLFFCIVYFQLQIVHSSFCGIHPSISTTSGHPSYLLVSLLFLICCKEKAISI